ncbi:hypothetical protein [Microbacterium sp. OVT16B]|uniref:hypothetical protein n=1 Tax=Microbacterium sp. OVT16B TaxID=2862682 RepID=UPI0011AFD7EF|nr:hypothetical protein [Microbacterium sp. OVT16B]
MLTRSARRLVIAGVVLSSVLVTTGCVGGLPFPSRPALHEPVSITVVGDRISWVQCLGRDLTVNYVSTRLREQSGAEREWALYTAEGDPDELIEIPSGVPVNLAESFKGLPVLHENDIAVSKVDGPVTVYLRLLGPEDGVEMAFRSIDTTSLVEGKYIYYSGEMSDEPCGMERE